MNSYIRHLVDTFVFVLCLYTKCCHCIYIICFVCLRPVSVYQVLPLYLYYLFCFSSSCVCMPSVATVSRVFVLFVFVLCLYTQCCHCIYIICFVCLRPVSVYPVLPLHLYYLFCLSIFVSSLRFSVTFIYLLRVVDPKTVNLVISISKIIKAIWYTFRCMLYVIRRREYRA